jgi:phage baseplate assembly protein W
VAILSNTSGAPRGLLRPLQRDSNDFASVNGQRLLESALGQLLGTRCDGNGVQGELPWRTEWGSQLHLIRHRNNDVVTAEMARQYIIEAVGRWMPMVRVGKVRVEQVDNTLYLLVDYSLMANASGQTLYSGQVRTELGSG